MVIRIFEEVVVGFAQFSCAQETVRPAVSLALPVAPRAPIHNLINMVVVLFLIVLVLVSRLGSVFIVIFNKAIYNCTWLGFVYGRPFIMDVFVVNGLDRGSEPEGS